MRSFNEPFLLVYRGMNLDFFRHRVTSIRFCGEEPAVYSDTELRAQIYDNMLRASFTEPESPPLDVMTSL